MYNGNLFDRFFNDEDLDDEYLYDEFLDDEPIDSYSLDTEYVPYEHEESIPNTSENDRLPNQENKSSILDAYEDIQRQEDSAKVEDTCLNNNDKKKKRLIRLSNKNELKKIIIGSEILRRKY